jgi:hypothetical protein
MVGDILLTASGVDTSPDNTLTRWQILGALATVPVFAFFLGSLWSLGSFLNSLLDPQCHLKSDFFEFSVLFPFPYVIAFMMIVPQNPQPWVIVLIFPFHFYLFYDLCVIPKSLVMVETGRRVTFYDYAGPFFLLWFFPRGWFMQPRIKRLYGRAGTSTPTAREAGTQPRT